ncbi:hypothetical protein BFW88_17785 [Pseudomonas fluorescens]|nr:hypothetical protein BFW88_17785 [Pseudomonas fluorescens]OPB07923.1 hypothetical protein BFW92_17725 [Pseudomonas fluorescens]OPB18698.1 hypothetical protein BFW93_17745 [Pseudomonas fluorescens]
MLQALRALCRRSHKTAGIKAAWAIGLIIFPLLGLIVWGLAGGRGVRVVPVRQNPTPPSSPGSCPPPAQTPAPPVRMARCARSPAVHQ